MFLIITKTTFIIFCAVWFCNTGNVFGLEQKPCKPVTVEVSQADVTNVVGSPISTNQTIQEFYSLYGGSFQGDLPTGPNTSLIALHQDTRNCDISIVVVHSQSGSGPTLGWSRMQFNGVDLSSPIIKDDAETFFLSDRYQYNALTDTSTVIWNWGTCCSDGLAHVLGPNWDGCIDVEATFASQSIQEWTFVSGTTRTTTVLQIGESLTLCSSIATPKPSQEPSMVPSLQPTLSPSMIPSTIPSNLPTIMPSALPSMEPSIEPTALPSSSPSRMPTSKPSLSPTTVQPSTIPPKQQALKNQPKVPATIRPTVAPSSQPVTKPSPSPTITKQGQDTTSTAPPSLRPVVVSTTAPTLKQEADHCGYPSNCPMWDLFCHVHHLWGCGFF